MNCPQNKQYPYDLITEYLIDILNIDETTRYSIESVPARSLLSPKRFDLMSKWFYIDCYVNHKDMTHAIEIYRDNINAFSEGSFLEPGQETKDSFDKYLTRFNELIDEIRVEGFDEHISLIPVGSNGMIMDGAHRVAACAYFDMEVTVIRFPDKKVVSEYDYDFFRRFLMHDVNMAYMAQIYLSLFQDCYMACIWPRAGIRKMQIIEEDIRCVGEIVYSQDVYLTYEGMRQFMIRIYGHQSWVGTPENDYAGVDEKAEACYDSRYPVRAYIFHAGSLDEVVNLKATVRSHFKLENHSIHISDDQRETVMMAQLLLNPESVEKLNRGGDGGTVHGDQTIPKAYRPETYEYIHRYQLDNKWYSEGVGTYREFRKRRIIKALRIRSCS